MAQISRSTHLIVPSLAGDMAGVHVSLEGQHHRWVRIEHGTPVLATDVCPSKKRILPVRQSGVCPGLSVAWPSHLASVVVIVFVAEGYDDTQAFWKRDVQLVLLAG